MKLQWPVRRAEQRSDPVISVDQWASYFTWLGTGYMPGSGTITTYGDSSQEAPSTFPGYVNKIYQSNGVIFACCLVRMLFFAEARFQFRRFDQGRPGALFGTDGLAVLEEPWPNGTTGDLLSKMIQHVDLAGNAYVRRTDSLTCMRPDWVSIVLGSKSDAPSPAAAIDAEVVGYIYHPGGRGSGQPEVPLTVEQVAHWAPIPDPSARFRGMSWISTVLREVMADSAATDHKLKFFEKGATPNLAIKFDPLVKAEAFKKWVEAFKNEHEGVANAYKTLFLGGGADVTVVGANMRQLDFKTTQGAGETRIAAAAGVPPVVVGLSEGLQSATYANYGLAMRRLTDLTMRPLWRSTAGALQTIIETPSGSHLWYDDRDIPALADDGQAQAQILQENAITIGTLVTHGFEPDSAVAAVMAGDFTKLVHTGMPSVQLQPATKVGQGKGATVEGFPEGSPPPAPAAAQNGSGGNA